MQHAQRLDITSMVSLEGESAEYIKLIRKLRWIGMEEEAARLQRALRNHTPGTQAVFDDPRSTE
jgi:hypothetical protein